MADDKPNQAASQDSAAVKVKPGLLAQISGGARIAAALVVIAAFVFGGLLLWNHFSSYEATDDAQVDGHIAAVSSRISGTVTAVYVQENQVVQAGTVLAKLDPTDYQVVLARAQADLADAQANVKVSASDVPVITATTQGQIIGARAGTAEAESGVQVAERQLNASTARVATARARLKEAEANSQKAGADLARLKQLVDKDEISRQQYDQAVAAAQSSQATVEAARAQATEAEQNVEVSQSQIQQAKDRVVQANAQLQSALSAPSQVAGKQAKVESAKARVLQQNAVVQQARLNLQYTMIVAPIAGIVGKKSVEVGQNVQVGQELMAIIPTNDLWVTANFKETQLRKMHVGQPVKIHVDAFNREYDGHIESIAGASGARFSLLPPENASGNYVKVVQRVPVRIRFEKGQNESERLRPGMSVTPKVMLR